MTATVEFMRPEDWPGMPCIACGAWLHIGMFCELCDERIHARTDALGITFWAMSFLSFNVTTLSPPYMLFPLAGGASWPFQSWRQVEEFLDTATAFKGVHGTVTIEALSALHTSIQGREE